MSNSMPGTRKLISVDHLGGIDASIHVSDPFIQEKPTLLMINSFTTSADLYLPQFEDKSLTDKLNLLAIEPLGHGGTRLKNASTDTFTYWDSAIMNLQVMDKLGIKKAFMLGTSQGGWMVMRMALLQPERVIGVIILGTSLDSESKASQEKGCWNAEEMLAFALQVTSPENASPSWTLPIELPQAITASCFGSNLTPERDAFWCETTIKNYAGDDGRRRLRQAVINLKERDGLHWRLAEFKLPVLRLHGDLDTTYSVAHAEDEMKLLKNAKYTKFGVIKGGSHYLSVSSPQEVDAEVVAFVGQLTAKL